MENIKQKAEELIDKMYLKVGNIYDSGLGINSYSEQKLRAIQCAIIAVEECIKAEKRISDITGFGYGDYWQSVREYLESIK